MSIAVNAESPLQDDIRALIDELNAALLDLTPPEFCFHMTVEEMAEPDTTVFVARDDGEAVACGALKRHQDSIGEVKRMYTRPSHRGRKIGAAIVTRIEDLAGPRASPDWCSKQATATPPPGPSMNGPASRVAGRCSTIRPRNGRCSTKSL